MSFAARPNEAALVADGSAPLVMPSGLVMRDCVSQGRQGIQHPPQPGLLRQNHGHGAVEGGVLFVVDHVPRELAGADPDLVPASPNPVSHRPSSIRAVLLHAVEPIPPSQHEPRQ